MMEVSSVFNIPPQPTPAERIQILGQYWQGNQSWYAEQYKEPYVRKNGTLSKPGGYHKRQGVIIPQLAKHVSGDKTFGQYQIDENDHVHWLCADADDERWSAEEAVFGCEFFASFGIQPVLEESSPGRVHLWVLLSSPLSSDAAYRFGLHYKARLFKHFEPKIMALGDDEVLTYPPAAANITDPKVARTWLLNSFERREFFPKQPHRDKLGFGNLVRLPWSLHQVKRTWSRVLSPIIAVNSPLKLTMALRKLDLEMPDPIAQFIRPKPDLNVSDRKGTMKQKMQKGEFVARIERCNDAITIPELVARALAVPEPKPGEKIQCPFHGAAEGSSGSDSFQVGGRIAKDVVWCWSDRCRLWTKKMTRLEFIRELYGIEDYGEALAQLEKIIGLD